MPKPSPKPVNDPCPEAFHCLRSYICRLQDEAINLEALIEGLSILHSCENGSNAFVAVITVALEKASMIANALDFVNLPALDTAPI